MGDISEKYFALTSPRPQDLRLGEPVTFSGFVLDVHQRRIPGVEIWIDGRFVAKTRVESPSEDVWQFLKEHSYSKRCRFELEAVVPENAHLLELRIRDEDQDETVVLRYQLDRHRERRDWFEMMKGRLSRIASPSGELVALTQGGSDVASYRDSMIPGVDAMQLCLEQSGVDPTSLRSVFELGCGTARILAGWHCDDRERQVCGSDINPRLVDWCQRELPSQVRVSLNDIDPPLSYDDDSFDFVYAISVFTHLSKETQEKWIDELARVLRPKGTLLMTLHGDVYVRITNPLSFTHFVDTGYLEVASAPQGANAFATYHRPEFVRSLVRPFELVGYFPQAQQTLTSVAALQDVYVLRLMK